MGGSGVGCEDGDEQAVASIGFIGGRRGGVPPVEGEIEGEEKNKKANYSFHFWNNKLQLFFREMGFMGTGSGAHWQ